jgi:hypothetical protein
LREEHRLRVLENCVLRTISGPKRDEVTGLWKRVHNVELHELYSAPSITRVIESRRMGWAGHEARMREGEVRKCLMGKPAVKRPRGKPRHRWEDDFKMDLQELEWRGVDWIDLAQDRDRWRVL